MGGCWRCQGGATKMEGAGAAVVGGGRRGRSGVRGSVRAAAAAAGDDSSAAAAVGVERSGGKISSSGAGGIARLDSGVGERLLGRLVARRW